MSRMSGPVPIVPRPRVALTLALGILVAVSAVAIAAEPSPELPGAVSPGASSAPGTSSPTGAIGSPAASPMAPAEVLISCGGGDAYRGLGIDAPAGARIQQTPEAAELRRAIRRYREDLGGASGWRIAGRTDDEVLFLGQRTDIDPPSWVSVVVRRTGEDWRSTSWGGCDPRIRISQDLGPADWWLDRAVPTPDAGTTQIQAFVMEIRCSGGGTAEGRIAEPLIVATPVTVTITIGVRPMEGDVDCEANQPTPYTITLPEPLGERQLLDGGHTPPIEPVPPEWLGSE